MPAKSSFSQKQHEILLSVVRRAAENKKKWKNQEQLALAIGITQPSLSGYLGGKWKPGVKIARGIAHLEGTTLEDLVGPFGEKDEEEKPSRARRVEASGHPNLELCVQFHASTHVWSPWTIAATRAGYFGPEDYPAPKWPERLNALEAAMEKARKSLIAAPIK